MIAEWSAPRWAPPSPDRAVIDIGSNTVRLVVYSGAQRAPDVWLNEKVAARLGRDLADTGRISHKSADMALVALRRFGALLSGLGVRQVEVVATAAARDASNGAEFLDKVRALGLEPRLLTGEEEARASACGVISAFPGAHGVVADLGGGSLELVSVEGEQAHQGVSLPLGTLRLGALRKRGVGPFKDTVHAALAQEGWAAAHPGPLYMVGGTWRAFAQYAMLLQGHPLHDSHGLEIPVDQADLLARDLVRADPAKLKEEAGLATMRATSLPDAAALLRVMLAELQPTALVFSSWGLREGLLHQKLPPLARRQDPLLVGVSHFTAPRGGSISRAATIAGWTADVARGEGSYSERLRLAAIMLALAAARLEPNLRTRHALDWALHKRWIGLDMGGRARIAAALIGACDKPALPPELLALADEPLLREAVGWGLAVRLCRRLGGGSRLSLAGSALRVRDGKLVLWFDPTQADLIADTVRADLAALAKWLGMPSEIIVGETIA